MSILSQIVYSWCDWDSDFLVRCYLLKLPFDSFHFFNSRRTILPTVAFFKDGQLNRVEMSIALHLVYRALKGDPVPAILPPSLLHRSAVSPIVPPPSKRDLHFSFVTYKFQKKLIYGFKKIYFLNILKKGQLIDFKKQILGYYSFLI